MRPGVGVVRKRVTPSRYAEAILTELDRRVHFLGSRTSTYGLVA